MRIGIDCRMYGLKHAGIGRYVMNLVENLMLLDRENEYLLFCRNDGKQELENLKFKIENSLEIVHPASGENLKWKIILSEFSHYSLSEQILFPSIIHKEKIDLMHFPHFNIPIMYRGKYVVTIHDLIKHTSKGKETTTKTPLLYWVKYLGYKFIFGLAIKRAEKIITPSEFVKQEVIRRYGVNPENVVVTYEGVDKCIKSIKGTTGTTSILGKYKIEKPYVLSVGSVYPHKNIERLIEAVKILNQSPTTNHQPPVTLVIVCARNVFTKRLQEKVTQMSSNDFVNFVGYVPDNELSIIYKEAEVFVFPTLSEGFGLPGLEAMAVGCPVVCSDIPVLHEIYKDNAVYFNPFDTKDMAEKIKNFLSDKKNQEKLKKNSSELVEGYSWEKMAKETLSVYQSVFKPFS